MYYKLGQGSASTKKILSLEGALGFNSMKF